MLTDEEIELGGYRFEDLQEKRIVKNRTDLLRKQTDLGFPLPIKTGASQAWFPKAEVNNWLRQRAALRAAPAALSDDEAKPAPRKRGRPKIAPELKTPPFPCTKKAEPPVTRPKSKMKRAAATDAPENAGAG